MSRPAQFGLSTIVAAALAALTVFAAFPATAQKQGGNLTVGMELDIAGFDPLKVGVYDTAALTGQQHIEINENEPTHVDPAVDYDSTLLTLAAQIRFGNTDGDATYAPGVFDEIEIVRTDPLLAAGGNVG